MKKILLFAALLALPLSVVAGGPENSTNAFVVVIDAAHGGLDHGAQIDGITEKEVVAAISSRLQQLASDRKVAIFLTRNGDEFVKLEDRSKRVNEIKPDLVLSLHVNASDNATRNGIEIFIPGESPYKSTASQWAVRLEKSLGQDLDRPTIGIKEAPFHLLKKSDAPAILIELGYLTNADDRAFLTEETSQERIASALLRFLESVGSDTASGK